VFVGGVGVLCGLVLAALFWSLTRSMVPSVVIGVATASILVVLAVAGGRYNRTFEDTEERRAEAVAKRARVRKAIEETQRRR
jgi:membrane protein implicated in regulation of membrane protease activity